jgi:hypothetical protein
MTTTFDAKCDILTTWYTDIRHSVDYGDFVTKAHNGVMLAYFTQLRLAIPSNTGVQLIDQAFDLLLEWHNLTDVGWEDDEAFFYPNDVVV